MSKYEHLLGIDPIGAFEKIKKDYVRYFENAYKIADEAINKLRLAELTDEQKNNLYRDPYLEILPEYESYPGINGIEDLASEFANAFGGIDTAKKFFADFIKTGLMSYKPYGHQVEMLKKAFVEGKNVVITSGTGSGKTESFLLPLFAQLFKEAKTWPKVDYDPNWHRARPYVPCQRAGENKHDRPAAIRALVLYPMNALVADQMSRLRKALDSNEVRIFMDNNLKNNRIFFGGYNGNTIAKKSYELLQTDKKRLRAEQEKIGESLDKTESQYGNIVSYYNNLDAQAKDDKKEVLFVNPRLDTDSPSCEMLTRWDMQLTPPDIMITNVSMLSIMLMRSAEENIFKQTKDWLAKDRDNPHPTRIFHLILDELHLYRGTSGSEVACLVRMLLDTIGLPPTIRKKDANGNDIADENGDPIYIPNPQLRILASSASLGSTQKGHNGEKSETEEYLEEFFGVYNSNGSDAFDVQKGTNYLPNEDLDLDFSLFARITPDFVDLEPEKQLEEMNTFVHEKPFECGSIVDFTHKYQKTIFARIYKAIPKNTDGSPRAISLLDLANTLFGSMEALRGFLIFRGFVDRLNEKGTYKRKGESAFEHRLPRIRFHQLFKYIEGLWGELQPTINDDMSIAVDQYGKETPPVKSLSYVSNEVGDSGNKILELLRCENCGELFFGGNRKVGDDDSMSLNYPDLSKMPNFNPTPMVQNKSYKDYAIFWPTHNEPEQDLNEKVALLRTGQSNFNITNGRGIWRSAYLHSKTGAIKYAINNERDKNLYIKGHIYYIIQNIRNQSFLPERIQALPCCCPHCGMDYSRRIHVKSPIRSFRTGIDRSNQLLSKELMYQLSEGSQKLIGFSDSREDAAKQAYGIEKEQYRDMVRMLFIDCVNEINTGVDKVIAQIEEDRRNGVDTDARTYTRKFDYWSIPRAREMADGYLDGNDLSQYKKEYVDLDGFVGNPNTLDGMLVLKLVELGINPAGPKYTDQFTNGAHTIHWNRAFDWNNFRLRVNASADYRQRAYSNLISAVFANSFGKYMGVSVLDAGIGYICCKRSQAKEDSREYKNLHNLLTPKGLNVYDFVDAFIRILGDNYRYRDDEFEDPTPIADYSHFGKYRHYILAVAEEYKLSHEALGNALYDYFSTQESADIILEFDQLGFRLLDPNASYYECPKCHRMHPNKGMGICTSCRAPLPAQPVSGKTVQDLWRHFISHDILVERKMPTRLHCEELTGQTDDIQSRLLEFKNLILLTRQDEQYREGEEKTKEIDMVNVTTTMEVGVDIGSLEAIFQGNMSPTRYNYQQRAGRGGRRGQAFSTAFTFCRGRSHDIYYYFKAPDEIVGGLPAAPKLSLAPYIDMDANGNTVHKMKLAIIKRVITKSILREAFRESGAAGFMLDLNDTSGEFGLPVLWKDNKPYIEQWISTHSDRIDQIIRLYTSQFNADGRITDAINQLRAWATCDPASPTNLIDEVTAIADNPTFADGLAQCLAEGGMLPMYGMPSDLREFYHGFNYDPRIKDVKSISRSSEMAINEFAPGSEKTKDKGTYRVEGLTTSLRYEKHSDTIIPMNSSDNDALRSCYTMVLDPNTIADTSTWRIDNIVPNDDILHSKVDIANGLLDNEKMLIIPQAYRSYKLFNNTGEAIDSNDRSSHFSMSSIFAKDNANCLNQKELDNVRMSAYGLYLNDEAEVWHVNTNNNELFKGKYAGASDNIDGTSVRYDQNNQLISSNNFMFYRLVTTQGANQREYMAPIDSGQYTFDIAIGSRKPTEMIKLEVKESNAFIDINIESGNASAIRAAFFSAAFLIQRTLADRLDVAPDEIEISEKIVKGIPQIYLSDTAPNGAGIVSYLYQQENLKSILEDITMFRTPFMKSLLDKDHSAECKTACQKCLLTYSNRGFHHVLDWRLGVGIVRLMLDKNFDFGFNPTTRSNYREYSDYDELVLECADKLGQVWTTGDYHKPINRRNVSNMIIYHPLWDKIRLIAYAKSENKSVVRPALYNTFKVLRSDFSTDSVPDNVEDIPPRGIDDQGRLIDPGTNLVMGIKL